jgi:hypothetical protein
MALTQPAASKMHQVVQEILIQPFDGKKMSMSRISSDTILNKLQNKLSGPTLPIVPCISGPFKVHHALYDWRASMNILPISPYSSSVVTGRFCYDTTLRDSKGCVD